MRIGGFDLTHYTYPGAAGGLQRTGALTALIAELGANYDTYHAALVAELARLGGRPSPERFTDFESYTEAWAAVQGVVHAEGFLRSCRAHVVEGRSLSDALDVRVPLVDANDQLVSVVSGS